MKVLFWDVEANDLNASWGHLLCCSFVGLTDEPHTYRLDKRPWKGSSLIDDRKLALAIRDELETADIICGWNSKQYDAKFLNARLSKHGERALQATDAHGTRHLDGMWQASSYMKVGGRKLDTYAKFFDAPNQKTGLNGDTWQLAAAGDKHAMSEVVEHCEADVLVLRDLWPQIAAGTKGMNFNLSEVWPWIESIPSRRNVA